ncbi:MAG: radical SAM protein [Candidatus Gastranaerophilales bacterium]|nr:radical SAM protein [Candidatus Gastranaerophilales bacterium]
MKYKSCHLIEHGISINVTCIQACCLSREFNKGQLMILPVFRDNTINWEELFSIKRKQRTEQKTKDLSACEGCYNLREEDWDEEDYISYINFDHWSQCNSNCIYCGVQTHKPLTKNNTLNAIKELIKQGKFKNNGEITFQGGEPTILKEFEDLLKLFIQQGSKIRIHSSGILFSRAIRNGLKEGAVTVIISPDSADKETYKRIKRVDKSNKVWDNIKHYRRGLRQDFQNLVKVKYIIIPGVNDSFEEVTAFLNKVKKYDIKSVIVDIEYTYANSNINNISPHIYILMDYIENFAKENNISYDLYDSALYASKNRKYEQTIDFNHENLKAKINHFQKLNSDKNIKYSN